MSLIKFMYLYRAYRTHQNSYYVSKNEYNFHVFFWVMLRVKCIITCRVHIIVSKINV